MGSRNMSYDQIYILDRRDKIKEIIQKYLDRNFDPGYTKELIFIIKNT